MADHIALNRRFGIPNHVTFVEDPVGIARAEVANSHAAASIVVQGAHLVSWTPRAQRPVIWLSPRAEFAPTKAIRGGVPVCWPWFGCHEREPSFPCHGIARTRPWDVIETRAEDDGSTRLAFRLIQDAAARAHWPHASELELHVGVGPALEMSLLTRNLGTEPITIGDALHTYFHVSDVRDVAVAGLEGRIYLDKADGGKRKQQSGPVAIRAETDRVYLEAAGDCAIDDPGFARRIRISKQGSRSTVVWNPWADKSKRMHDLGEGGYLSMLCVESANAADDVVFVPPGGEHRLSVRYLAEPLG